MGTISKEILSGSSNGKPILVSQTGSIGTLIHTTPTSSTIIDEIWLYASNTSSTQKNLTLEYGITGSTSEIILGIDPRTGLSIVLPGTILSGDGTSGSSLTAYASDTGSINVIGYVNRIIP